MITFRTLSAALIALIAAVTGARADSRMQVSAATTPLYAQPSANAQPVGQARSRDILFVSRMEGEWAAVSPPDRVDLWINKDFIEGNRVLARSIQVRTGPGIHHAVVGTLERGAWVMPRGEDGDWCKIAPPSSATLWVHQRDLSAIQIPAPAPQEVAVAPVETPAPAPAPVAAPAPRPRPAPPPVTPEPPRTPSPAAPSPPPPAPPPRVAPSAPQAAPPAPSRQPPAEPAPAPVAAPSRPVVESPPVHVATTPAPQPPPTLRPATALPAPQRPAEPAAAPAPPPPARRPVRASTVTDAVPAPSSTMIAHRSRDIDVAVDPALVDDLDLLDVPNQGAPVQVQGELRAAPFLAASPSRYRLLAHEGRVVEMVCHIHGKSAELRQYIGKGVSIRGREYWVEKSDMPVVVVGQIVPLAPANEPVLF